MEPRITTITLGVRDLKRSRSFYRDGLGWPLSSMGGGEIAVFHARGTVLALYARHLLAEDANLPDDGSGFGGITLGHNVANREQVDEVLAAAVAAGATLLKPAGDTFWGGYSGYFADPDGYPWEVAWGPEFTYSPEGHLKLPE